MSATALPFLIGLLTAILVVVIVYQLTLGVRVARSRRAAQLEIVSGQASAPEALTSPREARTLSDRLKAAGLDLGDAQHAETSYTLLRITVAILAAVGVLLLGLPPVLALVAGAAGYYLPQAWLAGETARRSAQIEKELPDALGDLIALLRVTPSIRNALDGTRQLLAQTNPRSPLAQEFQWTLEDMQASEEMAFKQLAERAASPALAMFAFALSIFARSGGDYLNALEAQARGIRQTLEARGTAQAEAADAMMTVKVIPAILLLVLVLFMQDPFFRSFYFTFTGQVILLGVLGCMVIGYQVVQSITSEVV
jgi:tight adherence protein B